MLRRRQAAEKVSAGRDGKRDAPAGVPFYGFAIVMGKLLVLLRLIVLQQGLGGGGQTGQPLNFAGDDDLGGLAVGRLLEGLQRLQLDDLVVGGMPR